MDPESSEGRKLQALPAAEDTQHEEGHIERQDGYGERDMDDDDDDVGAEEPRLKYVRLTERLGGVYRNGDATSTFLVSGDKMIVGTHNGNIHVISIPLFKQLRTYHAHTASVTGISICPYPIPRTKGSDSAAETSVEIPSPKSSAISSPSTNVRRLPVPLTSSNQIYIASSSIDGNVCIASLVDTKDVQVRNFGRPLQSVALSPDFKSDRTYLSGGLSGKLILTAGGRTGTSSSAHTTGSPAANSGWLASLGLGSGNAKDSVLHSGEGAISTIRWSLTGRYVVWVNERGLKIIRSNIGHDAAEPDSAWKRIGHVDRPSGVGWEEMSTMWKCRAEWVDLDALELSRSHEANNTASRARDGTRGAATSGRSQASDPKLERLVVGWGGMVWIIDVHPGRPGTGKDVGERVLARAEIVTIKRFDDCVVSGLSLLSPTLLVVLASVIQDEGSGFEDNADAPTGTGVAGSPRNRLRAGRRQALKPELRLIDLALPDEDALVSADSLSVSRYENLSPADYHLGGVLGAQSKNIGMSSKGRFEGVGEGFLAAGQKAVKLLGPTMYARSAESANDTIAASKGPSTSSSTRLSAGSVGQGRRKEPPAAAAGPGMKIYIHSPYDCILALERDLQDHLDWLIDQEKYGEAWEVINERPDLISSVNGLTQDSSPSTPTKRDSSSEHLDLEETSMTPPTIGNTMYSAAEKEKRRIGEEWIKQLIKADDWGAAGAVCGKVLGTSARWEHWVWVFAQADKFEEITPHIPTTQLHPPLPPMVYEYVLGYYISHDRIRFKELLALWPPDLFDLKTITDAIDAKLKSGSIREDTVEGGKTGRDWQILMEALAELLVADSRPREALKCYMRLKDADAVMKLIRTYSLLDAVADDIAGLLLLRVTEGQLRTSSIAVLEAATSDAVSLLVEDAIRGVVRPSVVVRELDTKLLRPFLFFYLRDLWRAENQGVQPNQAMPYSAGESLLVDEFGDTIVELFAEYDRSLLLQFLQHSHSYIFEKACAICEQKNYISELVYLLSKTGETKRALFLIIDKLGDVSQAIAFAKSQNDDDLWDDLLNYSMEKPRFIRGLLEGVGTAIDPVTLVRRIPDGLEIEGLRSGLSKILKEFELQYSISEGAAKILRGEVGIAMETSRTRQRKGVKFDVGNFGPDLKVHGSKPESAVPGTTISLSNKAVSPLASNQCVGCNRVLQEDETDTLVGFACEHIFHLKCLVSYKHDPNDGSPEIQPPNVDFGEDPQGPRTVGAKVTRARILRDRIMDGCPVRAHITRDLS